MNRILLLLVSIFFCACYSKNTGSNPPDSSWKPYLDEIAIDQLVDHLSTSKQPADLLIRNVSLITMKDSIVVKDQDVLVRDGLIAEIVQHQPGRAIPKAVKVIDGTGRYLIPGLTDAHVHVSESNAEKLLFILNGITTVRDMCGFPWMIDYRKQIEQNKLLAPNTYLTGTMLNSFELGVYADVVKTEDQARAAVRRHKEMGYDFIKVWNALPLNLLKAVADESKKQGLTVVGHIPHNIKIEEAIVSGMRTLEHLKGFYSDNKLIKTQEDYSSLIRKSDNVWICPTAIVFRSNSKSREEIEQSLKQSAKMKYVSPALKEYWRANAGLNNEVARKIDSLAKIILKDLADQKVKWLAGTDNNGSNQDMVAGFSLLEEIEMLKNAGIPAFSILQASTINPAEAFQKEKTFGTVEVGKRADLLLLDKNPLSDLTTLRRIQSVIVRGIYFSNREIEKLLKQIEDIYKSHPGNSSPVNTSKVLFKHYSDPKYFYLRKPSTVIDVSKFLSSKNFVSEAVSLMEENIKPYPYFYMYDALAEIYLHQRDTTKAIDNLKRSLSLNEHNEESNNKLKVLSATRSH